MGFLRRIFRRYESVPLTKVGEQAVLVHLNASSLPQEVYEKYDLATLEDRIRAELVGKNVGEYDGNEIGPGEAKLYLYGPDAETLFKTVEPVLNSSPLCSDARVVIRKGGPGAPQRETRLPAA